MEFVHISEYVYSINSVYALGVCVCPSVSCINILSVVFYESYLKLDLKKKKNGKCFFDYHT